MGCVQRTIRRRFAISVLLLLITTSTPFITQGRKLVQTPLNSKRVTEVSAIFRAQIGSRPPRCDRRCSSCPYCEPIQVPQRTAGSIRIAYARDSNYKPMTWKCKCGDLIFNP